jgi:hypothetical protein
MTALRKTLRRTDPKAYITIEELYNEYDFDLQFDDSENCYYLEDPDNDDFLDGHLTPCLPDIWELERWINEHWDEVSRGLTKRQDGEAEEEDVKRQEIIAKIRLLKETS